ncbi:hypothetical protein GX50_05776 [[Emmonsia] crescens]|uniref:Uncharacterized protein n=1 Tax=[Emmonsia] crescens TaxID=73230 RepID=A0A2B7ZEJ5_9EURO|nr:hypothetical protein GX50_05776 [Emmonsia crescens]
MSIAVPGIGYLAWADAIRKPSNRTQGSLHQGDYHIWPIREGDTKELLEPYLKPDPSQSLRFHAPLDSPQAGNMKLLPGDSRIRPGKEKMPWRNPASTISQIGMLQDGFFLFSNHTSTRNG